MVIKRILYRPTAGKSVLLILKMTLSLMLTLLLDLWLRMRVWLCNVNLRLKVLHTMIRSRIKLILSLKSRIGIQKLFSNELNLMLECKGL